MQETLNKMVASVRHGIISPEDASRTIHECAAMLRLELAEKIPETALIITGMRKAVKADGALLLLLVRHSSVCVCVCVRVSRRADTKN